MMQGAPVINVTPTANPISITLSDGQTILSTHTFNLNILWLPVFITEAQIVPGITHSSLIFIKRLCDKGCKVIYNKTEVTVIYDGKLVLSRGRNTHTACGYC